MLGESLDHSENISRAYFFESPMKRGSILKLSPYFFYRGLCKGGTSKKEEKGGLLYVGKSSWREPEYSPMQKRGSSLLCVLNPQGGRPPRHPY